MKKSKSLCNGCRNDFYNGHNGIGVKECWSFKDAKVCKRTFVGTWQPPPYTWNPRDTLTCWHGNGLHPISKDDCRLKENYTP